MILKMKLKNLLPIFLFFIVGFPVVSAHKCGETGFFILHGKFDTNRGLLLSSLASNVSSRGGFYNSSVGQGSDRVYAVGMCIPGTEPKVCSNCIDLASAELMEKCPNQTEGLLWFEKETLCMIRYSNRFFFGSLDMGPSYKVYNTAAFQVNLTEFDNTWEALMLRLIAEATSLSNPMYYGAGIQKIGTSRNIYAFVLCSKDISPWNCAKCLRQNVDDYRSCCSGKQGGLTLRLSCFMEWDLYPFFGVFENKTSLTPPREKVFFSTIAGVEAATEKFKEQFSRRCRRKIQRSSSLPNLLSLKLLIGEGPTFITHLSPFSFTFGVAGIKRCDT